MSSLEIRLEVDQKVYSRDPSHRTILQNLSLTFQSGGFYCLCGPSGCGKTTLLNILSGLDKDFAGRLTIPPSMEPIAYVFQEPNLLPWKTVYRNLAFVMRQPDPQRIANVLAEVGIPDAADLLPNQLSLGMARRVSICRALLFDAKVMLLDEPFVSLDQASAARLCDMIIALQQTYALTVVLVTHDLAQAYALGDTLLFLDPASAGIQRIVNPEIPRSQRDRDWINQEVAQFTQTAPGKPSGAK